MKTRNETSTLSRWTSLNFMADKWEAIRNAATADGTAYNGLIIDALQRYRHRLEHEKTGPITAVEAVRIQRAARDAAEAGIVGRKGRLGLHAEAKNTPPRDTPEGMVMAPLKLPKDLHAWLRERRGIVQIEARERKAMEELEGKKAVARKKKGKTGRRDSTMALVVEQAIDEYLANRDRPEKRLTLEEGATMRKIARLARQRHFEVIAKDNGLDPEVFLLKDEIPISRKEAKELLLSPKNEALYNIAMAEVASVKVRLSILKKGDQKKKAA